MATRKISRHRHQLADKSLLDGLNKHGQSLPPLLIGGRPLQATDLIAMLQGRIDAAGAAEATKASWLTAVKADYDERAKTRTAVSGLRQALHIAFDGSIDVLADFGLAPRKVAVMTPEQKTAATAKAKATRAARHTMGKRQKAEITGTASEVVTATPDAGALRKTTAAATTPQGSRPARG
ncbi:MAG: hypothetical protein ACLP1X_27960 [Polyangiaceae bacterium]|jgi:hypothetical protein